MNSYVDKESRSIFKNADFIVEQKAFRETQKGMVYF